MFEPKEAGSGRLVANLRAHLPLKLFKIQVFKLLNETQMWTEFRVYAMNVQPLQHNNWTF